MSRENFESFVVTDPNLVDQQLDVSKLATTTPTRKELLGGISTLPGVKYDPTLQSSFTDLLAYFSGGLPRLPQTPTASNVNVPLPGGSGGGGGGITTASTVQPTTTVTGGGVNTPFEQNLINQGAGVQIAPGQPVVAPGEMPVTQEEMDAFNQTPASTTTLPSGDVFATDDPMLQEKIDFTPETKNIFQKAGQTVLGAAEDLKNAGYSVVQQGKDLIANIGGKSIDIGKTITSGALNLISSKITGVPLLGTAAQIIGAALPKQDPRQTALNELYDVKDGTIQTGPMAGYNPVSGGIPGISDPTYGLQDAYDKRIGTIENTLKDKYNMSDAEIADVKAGSYKGDVDTNLLDTLTDLDKAKAKEKSILDLYSGDIQDTGDAGLAELEAAKTRAGIQPTDPFLDIPDRQYAEPTIDKDIGTMETTAGVNPFADIDTGAGEFNITAPIQLGPTPAPVGSGRGGDPRQFMDQPAAANNINISGGLPTYETLPEGASKTGTPIDAFNPINRQQHFDNTEKLKDAVREGKISNETYNRLSAFDARKTMGLGAVTGTLASGAYQGIQSLAGMGQAVADQPIGEAIDDTVRNIQGVSGNITPEEQIQYQEIISGEDIYRDPIMGMVDQPTRGTLAGEPGLPDLMDEFDMTAFDEPIAEPTPMRQRLDELRRERDLGVGPQFMDMAESEPLTNTQLAEMPMEEFENLLNNTGNDLGKAFDLIEARQEGKEYLDDLEEIGKDADYIGYTEQEKADIAAGKKVPQLGELLDFGLDQTARQAQAEQAAQRARDEAAARAREEAAARARDEAAAARAREEAARKAQERMNQRDDPAPEPKPSAPVYQDAIMRGQTGGGSDGGGGCFLKGTQVTMADGSTKAIEQVDLGDNVAKGGKVFATGKFLVENLHDYKGIKVSGSHMVSEDGNWVRVEDSKYGKALGDDEHTVYVFGAENRRILINNILFTDYFEVNEQDKLLNNEKDFFNNWKLYAKQDSGNNVDIINAS
jgi:hypothetical protein